MGRQLTIRPIGLTDANSFVERNHRHHGSVIGHKYSLCAIDADGALVGVCIVGRPVARALDDGASLEVTRLASDGTPNVCSALYAAAAREARRRGARRIITYTLVTESGISLRAAGWERILRVRGRGWSCPSRPRADKHPICAKVRWQRRLT